MPTEQQIAQYDIDKMLKKRKKKISDLLGVAVVVGLGRFTATRIAVTVANTLSFALRIPVTAVNSADIERAEKLLRGKRAGVYVSAKYSGEARIGQK